MSGAAHEITDLAKRYEVVLGKIEAAALGCKRPKDEIALVAVTTLKNALSLGIKDLGENRVQEAEDKIVELGRNAARWHLIGHLQANKVRRAVRLFDVIHSVDSVGIAQRLERSCREEGRAILPVLIQVDLAGEATKSGISENDLAELAETIALCERLQLQGLMTVPPFFPDPEQVRPFFRLRKLRDGLQSSGCFGADAGELSMGMSHDFKIAIEEGATIVRIGTALFGERQATQ